MDSNHLSPSSSSRLPRLDSATSILHAHARLSPILRVLVLRLRRVLAKHELLELGIGALEVVVDDDAVVHAGRLGILELVVGLREALLDRLLGLGAAVAQAGLERGEGRRRDEDVARGDGGGLDLLDALCWGEGEGKR